MEVTLEGILVPGTVETAAKFTWKGKWYFAGKKQSKRPFEYKVRSVARSVDC